MLIYLIILLFATVCKRFFHWSKSCHAVQSKSALQNKRGRMLSVHYSELNFEYWPLCFETSLLLQTTMNVSPTTVLNNIC